MPDGAGASSSGGGAKAASKHATIATGHGNHGMQEKSFGANSFNQSVQGQLELNDIPEFANEPGPGHYFGPESYNFSSLGNQKLSKCISAPEVGFPRTGWPEWERVMITKGHEKAFMGRESAGFMYEPKDSALYEVKPGVPGGGAKIGTSLRPDLAASLGVDPHGSPGPCYNLRDAPDPADRMIIMKNRSFGQASRFSIDRPGSLGPGQYDRNDSSLKLGTGKSFGCHRKAYDKVVRPGWEKEGLCRNSLGVGPPLWVHPRDGSLATTIGRAERFGKPLGQQAPGPGQYDREERDLATTLHKKGGSVCSDTNRPGSLKFGKLPKKPRFRMLLAQQTCRHGGWGYF